MLKWITGGKLDHPLADRKQARALVAELPAYEAVKALEELTRWLESLIDAEGFRLDPSTRSSTSSTPPAATITARSSAGEREADLTPVDMITAGDDFDWASYSAAPNS